jgi:hypothetical protein
VTPNQERRELVAMANSHLERMSAAGMSEGEAFAYVKNVIDSHQVVVGVWQDSSEPDGVDMHVIKGMNTLAGILMSGASADVKISAVPCVSYDQAVAAQELLGDGVLVLQ